MVKQSFDPVLPLLFGVFGLFLFTTMVISNIPEKAPVVQQCPPHSSDSYCILEWLEDYAEDVNQKRTPKDAADFYSKDYINYSIAIFYTDLEEYELSQEFSQKIRKLPPEVYPLRIHSGMVVEPILKDNDELSFQLLKSTEDIYEEIDSYSNSSQVDHDFIKHMLCSYVSSYSGAMDKFENLDRVLATPACQAPDTIFETLRYYTAALVRDGRGDEVDEFLEPYAQVFEDNPQYMKALRQHVQLCRAKDVKSAAKELKAKSDDDAAPRSFRRCRFGDNYHRMNGLKAVSMCLGGLTSIVRSQEPWDYESAIELIDSLYLPEASAVVRWAVMMHKTRGKSDPAILEEYVHREHELPVDVLKEQPFCPL